VIAIASRVIPNIGRRRLSRFDPIVGVVVCVPHGMLMVNGLDAGWSEVRLMG